MSDFISPQLDRFTQDRLPSADRMPVINPIPEVPMEGELNCAEFLIDRNLEAGRGDRTALLSDQQSWTYSELALKVDQLAALLVHEYQVKPGNRVLIRGANSPEVAASWLAIQKIGAVAVTTMSLLRDKELAVILEMSQPVLAICSNELSDDLDRAIQVVENLIPVRVFTPASDDLFDHGGKNLPSVETCRTLADDVSLIAFTSGTTGKPKATIHFHRDVLAICKTVCDHMLKAGEHDRFIGTAPLAFTFGLGGLLVFPLYCGASSILNAKYRPADFIEAIHRHKATICFTVPTYYQQVMKLALNDQLSTLRLAVSSGEALPLPVREAWDQQTGIELVELLGSTEMLHAFIGAQGADIKPGYIGPTIYGYEAAILDEEGKELPAGEVGRLAVRGPTGCRYLDDDRQLQYVQNGWNITGDACLMTQDGYITYHTRFDDMIISSGYNISGLEVENAILDHSGVLECAVIGQPDEERGQVVSAFIVASDKSINTEKFIRSIQDHVKAKIAPYKYPRRVFFLDALPRNESGKIQRFRLK